VNTNPSSGTGGGVRTLEEAIARIEAELSRAVAYVNDAVIPEVRSESIAALRSAASAMAKLADRFEAPKGRGPQ
jgi:hypothetical protein